MNAPRLSMVANAAAVGGTDVPLAADSGVAVSDLLALAANAAPIDDTSEWLTTPGQFVVRNGKKDASPANIYAALRQLDVRVSYNTMAAGFMIGGMDAYGPKLDDAAMNHLRILIEKRFDIVCAKERFFDIITDHAREHSFNPLLDRLSGLEWDQQPRLDKWTITYGGADDTPYTRAVSRIALMACSRRAHEPGVKFDNMPVFEGPQGCGKSSALRVMAIDNDWFTDSAQLDADSKTFMEQIAGRWIVEEAELNGLIKAAPEKLKSTLSRQFDTARLAYGRMPTEQPRQCVLFGTTNSDDYLRDTTGNRRFWPIKVTGFDLAELRRDRDQLWAEAVERERKGEPITLPEELWAEAARQQKQRVIVDPFEEVLFGPLIDQEGKVRAEEIWSALGLSDKSKRSQAVKNRLSAVMLKHGWASKQLRFGGPALFAYSKGDSGREIKLSDQEYC